MDNYELLTTIIREAGMGWMIDSFSPPGQALSYLASRMTESETVLAGTCTPAHPQMTVATIARMRDDDVYKLDAFLQSLASIHSPSVLACAWLLIWGGEVTRLAVSYEEQRRFHMSITVRSPHLAAHEDEFISDDIDDAVFLRHLGIMKIDDQPAFDGYHALRMK